MLFPSFYRSVSLWEKVARIRVVAKMELWRCGATRLAVFVSSAMERANLAVMMDQTVAIPVSFAIFANFREYAQTMQPCCAALVTSTGTHQEQLLHYI